MSAFLKALHLKKAKSLKHKKLGEDSWNSKDVILEEGLNFYVKYLGSVLVDNPNGEETTADAIKTIVSMVRMSHNKIPKVALNISLRGVKVTDIGTGETSLDISIYQISFCSADGYYDHVFAFLANNPNDTMECHAFLCPKRKMTEAVAVAVAQAFQLAYEFWEDQDKKPAPDIKIGKDVKYEDFHISDTVEHTDDLIDFEDDHALVLRRDSTISTGSVEWVNFPGKRSLGIFRETDEFGILIGR